MASCPILAFTGTRGMDKGRVSGEINEFEDLNKDSALHIFRNGSKDPSSGKAGFGLYILNNSISKSL